MKLERRFEGILKVAVREKNYRPVLEQVQINRLGTTRGVMVAADGFVLAVVPVELDEEDETGTLSAGQLEIAIRMAKANDPSFYKKQWGVTGHGGHAIRLTRSSIVLQDGTVLPRKGNFGNYPDVERVILGAPTGAEPENLKEPSQEPRAVESFFNANYIGKIGKLVGFGWPESANVVFSQDAKLTTILLTPASSSRDSQDYGTWLGRRLPFGLVMPVHFAR